MWSYVILVCAQWCVPGCVMYWWHTDSDDAICSADTEHGDTEPEYEIVISDKKM